MNNYQLYLFKHTLPDGTYKYLQDAIKAGIDNDVPFEVKQDGKLCAYYDGKKLWYSVEYMANMEE